MIYKSRRVGRHYSCGFSFRLKCWCLGIQVDFEMPCVQVQIGPFMVWLERK